MNQRLIKLSKELNIPLVATNDTHYINKEDYKAQDTLICIQTGKKLHDSDRMKIEIDEFYLKSPEEMKKAFINLPEAIENTVKIANSCNFNFEFGDTKLPEFILDSILSHEEYLSELCKEGLKNRYPHLDNSNVDKGLYNSTLTKFSKEELEKRLNYELDVINSMGFTDYFLIVWDLVKYAKDNNIPVGPGRGSGAGSLAAYTLGITDIDPIKYDLLFERFLNPDRISMPDFDIDFCNENREKIIEYASNKYGSDHVAQIITFGTMSAKAVIRDVGRVLDSPFNIVNTLAKFIPNGPKIKIDDAIKNDKEFEKYISENVEAQRILEYARKLEGMPRNISTHACGVVITNKPVLEYVPLYNNEGNIVTQYTMETLSDLGLLKMDFLGLRTLTVIEDTKKIIKKIHNIDVEIPRTYDDPNVYKLWQKGDLMGVFQFESDGMRKVMKELMPDNLEDIIAGVSLYRPGPMNQIPRFIKGKRDPNSVTYLDESLKPILEVTYGCMVYQEQIMQIARELAGYTLARADLLRRAMGKKKLEIMQEERETFVNGCLKNNISKENANIIFDEMMEFAKYAFNKSHAAAYSILSYQTAYLKTYYRAEFLAATMNSYLGNLDKVPTYIEDAISSNIEVLAPSVNESFMKFTKVKNENKIRFGLGSIKNVGITPATNIIEERKRNGDYKDFTDFVTRVYPLGVNKKAIESLVKCGACDNLGYNRATLIASYEEVIASVTKNKNEFENQQSLFELFEEEVKEDYNNNIYTLTEDLTQIQKLAYEKELIGIYVSGHPLSKIYPMFKDKINFNSKDFKEIKNKESTKTWPKDKITTLGIVDSIKKRITKKGTVMYILTIDDIYGQFEVVCFENTWDRYKNIIVEGSVLALFANMIGRQENNISLFLEQVAPVQFKKSEK